MDLSIITLTVPSRAQQLEELAAKIYNQIHTPAALSVADQVEHLVVPGDCGYGVKMRYSLECSKGRYVCWLDDDDDVAPDYVANLLFGITFNPDVVTFGCDMVGYRKMWLRANRMDRSGAYDGAQVWAANHYCAWKREIALSAPFLPRNYGSETAWYKLISAAYPNLNEYHIPKFLHYYHYDQEKTLCQDQKSIERSLEGDCDDVTLLRTERGLGIAVGRAQPLAGRYVVTMPDYKLFVMPEHEVTVLGRFRYE